MLCYTTLHSVTLHYITLYYIIYYFILYYIILFYIILYYRASRTGDAIRVMYSSVSVGVVRVLCACAQVQSTV